MFCVLKSFLFHYICSVDWQIFRIGNQLEMETFILTGAIRPITESGLVQHFQLLIILKVSCIEISCCILTCISII